MHNDKLTPTDLLAHRAYLSRRVNEMLDFIGAEATAALLNTYSGKSLCVPQGITQQGRQGRAALTQLLGKTAADRFCAFAIGYSRFFLIPRCEALRRHLRHQRIIAEFDRLTTGSAAFNTYQEACDWIDDHTTPETAGMFTILPTDGGRWAAVCRYLPQPPLPPA